MRPPSRLHRQGSRGRPRAPPPNAARYCCPTVATCFRSAKRYSADPARRPVCEQPDHLGAWVQHFAERPGTLEDAIRAEFPDADVTVLPGAGFAGATPSCSSRWSRRCRATTSSCSRWASRATSPARRRRGATCGCRATRRRSCTRSPTPGCRSRWCSRTGGRSTSPAGSTAPTPCWRRGTAASRRRGRSLGSSRVRRARAGGCPWPSRGASARCPSTTRTSAPAGPPRSAARVPSR